jgi:large subunit ribosomal protein L22
MAIIAKARFISMSPSKGVGLMREIQGKPVEDAFAILKLSKKKSSIHIRKVLASAVSNARNNPKLRAEKEKIETTDLYVRKAMIDGGPTLQRIKHRAMGRVFRIRKRTSHIVIELGLTNEKV